MRNELRSFDFGSNAIRVVQGDDGEPLWVAKDVAEALGYVWNGAARVQHVPEEWRGVTSVVTPSGIQEMAVLTEHGLYFFLSRSDKPAALPFQKWIAGEVLPEIRKTGSYRHTLNPASMSRLQLIEMALEAEQERLALESKVMVLEPKAEALDRIATSEGSLCLSNAAKTLGVPPRQFFGWLNEHRWIFRRPGGKGWVAYQERIQQGLLEHKVTTVQRPDGTDKVVEQVLMTPKGLARLSSSLNTAA